MFQSLEELIAIIRDRKNSKNEGSYTNQLLNKDTTSAISTLYNLYDCGYSTMDIYDNYFLYIKYTPILLCDNIRYEIIKLLCEYITIFHNVHEDEIELALFTNNIMSIF